tara:strand:+ start:40 stop:732 length:693 start_codon:yes stop_codon:yes gene_type:complete
MIISHKYKFIFVKTSKTAGSSIIVDLNKFLDEKDICSNVFPRIEGHQPKNDLYSWAKFFPRFKNEPKFNNKYFIRAFYRSYHFLEKITVKYKQHSSARYIREKIGDDVFNNYFKFCVERNPIDKCISEFNMKQQRGLVSDWKEYITKKQFPCNYSDYTDENGELMVNKILKYENLEEELNEVTKQLGIPFNQLNTRAKGNYRKNKFIISDSEKKIIKDSFIKSNRFTKYF